MTIEDDMLTAAKDLTAAAPHAADAHTRLKDQRRGLPGSALGGNGGGHTSASPVESALGLNNPADPHGFILPTDRAAAALQELAELEKRLKRDAYRYRVLVTAAAARPADAKARREAERANTTVTECAHTRRTVDRHEPAHRTSDCGGVLPEPIPLCRWVYDFTRSAGRLPSAVEMDRHHKGQQIRVGA